MDEDYNWGLISKVAVPIALVSGYAFYSNISDGQKNAILVAAMLLAGFLIYMKSRKKANIFTAAAIVFLITILVKFLKASGLIR